MDNVVQSCFTTSLASPDLGKHVTDLKNLFYATELSETLKLHVILHHLEDSVRCLNGEGLGLWSEQAGESIHRSFLTYWDRYKINLISDPSYGERLKLAVIEFSSKHV